jgi:hypothetical protein
MTSRLLTGMLALASLACAGDTPLERSTLRGLTKLNVVVDPLDPELQKAGVSAGMLRARLVRRLEMANIVVDDKAPEFLGLRLMHVRRGRGPFAVCVSLGAYQPVTLARDPQIKTATETWDVHTVMMAELKGLSEATAQAVDELVDGFIAAHRSSKAANAAEVPIGPARVRPL